MITPPTAPSPLEALVFSAAAFFDEALAALEAEDAAAGAAARQLAASGVLRVSVACAAGRGLWRATLDLTDVGAKTIVLFDREWLATLPPVQ